MNINDLRTKTASMLKQAERRLDGAITHSHNRWSTLTYADKNSAIANEMSLYNEADYLREALKHLMEPLNEPT